MSVAKMKLVNIVGRLRDFDSVVSTCCINGDFHPEQASTVLDSYEEFVSVDEPNPYVQHLRMAVDLGVHSGIKLGFRSFDDLNLDDDALGAYIEKTRDTVNAMSEKIRALTQSAAHLEQGIQQLDHLRSFNMSLDDLFSSKFIKVRIGRLPKESYAKLDVYDEDELMFFFPLGEDRSYYWGIYVALRSEAEKIDELFNSLYFERIRIIEEAHGTPLQAITSIQAMLDGIKKELSDTRAAFDDFWDDSCVYFLKVYSRLKYLHDSFELRKYSVKCGESFYIFGWVPETEIPAFAKHFETLKYVDCIIENEQEAGSLEPPTSLVNGTAAKPFESFVSMYGLPAYNEIDPTPFMATTYSVIFGIMFGDLGQGFIILLVGLFLSIKKKSQLGGILIRCSIFSMIFGTLYNSVFGYETVLPFTLLPVHSDSSTNFVLLAAIAIGFVLILGCMVLNMANGIRQHSIEKIFFSNNGVAGMVLYVFCVVAAYFLMGLGKNIITPILVILLVLVPLLLIFFRAPLARLLERRKDWKPESPGEFFIESFFELFEILLSYLSNTISFIRIGAFILSHAGMMLAVFTISELFGNGQNPVALVLGNVFVIALEGLMVGIQGIRLQFYEMFSRFYTGSGRAYEPVKIKYDN
ncbi:MAG: V-type ATPase 116kDa subunit family protein [Clostridia bacterium]|nr:V-type ATPase 116kDa subunit family protein [Clostridia bacterium]